MAPAALIANARKLHVLKTEQCQHQVLLHTDAYTLDTLCHVHNTTINPNHQQIRKRNQTPPHTVLALTGTKDALSHRHHNSTKLEESSVTVTPSVS